MTIEGEVGYAEGSFHLVQLPKSQNEDQFSHIKDALDNIIVAKFNCQSNKSTLMLLGKNLRVRSELELQESLSHIRTIVVTRARGGYRIAWILHRQTYLDIVLIARNKMVSIKRPDLTMGMNFGLGTLAPFRPNIAVVSMDDRNLHFVSLERNKIQKQKIESK